MDAFSYFNRGRSSETLRYIGDAACYLRGTMLTFLVGVLSVLIVGSHAVGDVRIKDITFVDGQLRHTLTGVGLVSGLAGTGGTNPQTREFVANFLQRVGNRIGPVARELLENNTRLKTDNVSVVAVTAKVPEYATPGTPFDVTVSVLDDAENLQGGVLISTPLFAVDGNVYATASGAISTGGFSFSGDAGTAQKNHPTTGLVPRGGTMQEAICEPRETQLTKYRLSLVNPDLETAKRIVDAINQIAKRSAKVITPALVEVRVPLGTAKSTAEFMSEIDQLRIAPDTEARVVINERTGTVVFGENVKISKVAIAHANLTVVTSENPEVSQPEPLSEGETTVVPRTNLEVLEGDKALQVVEETTSVGDLVTALNALGVTPRDLSSIFQRLKDANALHAKLEFR